jgi:hypothetical protein
MIETLYNFYLKIRYRYFRRFVKKIDFGWASYTEDFNNPSYDVHDGEQYNDNITMIKKKECVLVENNKLLLYTKHYEDPNDLSKKWAIGWVELGHKENFGYGIWSITCKLPVGSDNWPAIWLLHKTHPDTITKTNLGVGVTNGRTITCSRMVSSKRINYNWYVWFDDKIVGFVKNYDRVKGTIEVDRDLPVLNKEYVFVSVDNIIPEIDIIEIIDGNLKQTIHYGYSSSVYCTTSWGVNMGLADYNKEYTFSVDNSDKGYKFYIDGILTGVLTKNESICDAPTYLLLNNAKEPKVQTGNETVFEIHSVNFHEK